MFSRTKPKELEDFAIDLAREFSKRCPPGRPGKTQRALGLAQAIDDICNRATEFQKVHRMGLYGKAKLGTEFKLKLKDFGYPADFVDELTGKLLMSMSGK